MKLKDIKISTKLTLGFGTCIFLVVLMGIVSLKQAGRLWQNTNDLYNHPYQVGRTVRDIQSQILEIHRKMKDIAMDEGLTDDQIRDIVHYIDSVEIEVFNNYTIVKQLYLGPREDIDKSFTTFSGWKRVRDDLIAIRLNYGRDEAYKTYISVNRVFINSMIPEIQKLIQFSSVKGDSFYEQAGIEKDKLFLRFSLLFFVIIIATSIITYTLIRGIRIPLHNLTLVTEEYSKGNYSVRNDYNSQNELGTLASTFNKMASSVQNDIGIKENAAWIAKLLMDENELKPFCSRLIKALLTKTESQIAAIYIWNRVTGKFEHYDSVGLSAERIRDFSSQSGEGEFGPLLSQKRILHISDIPDDTVFSFPAVTGNFKPREIASIPIVDEDVVIAVISLATLKNYSDLTIRLLNDIQVIITARFLGVLNFQKTKDYSVTLDLQNRELDQKSKELLMQSYELKEYNIELEQQKKQLDEANKLKSSFLSNMSHELRTPLNSVIALSGVLNRRLSGKIPEDEYNYLGIIEKNGKNLLSLINDILDLSRIESGKEELVYSRFSLNDLLSEILNSMETIAAEKGISISTEVQDGFPLVICDRKKAFHILQNVISNAVKFTEKGTVAISAKELNGCMKISITDTGIGIPEDFMPYVFDEFRQADDRFSRKFGGTGLGLAIVKKYCQMLDGSIEVSSNNGAGSTFIVTLPLIPSGIHLIADADNEGVETMSPVYTKAIGTKKGVGKTLLLVEDCEPQIIQLKDILNDEGYDIHVARNGREALDSIKTSIPDAMILDLQMPEVDGFEVLKQIRNLNETKSIPVLILTAKHISKSELGFLKENNVHQLIRKGDLNRAELIAHVDNLIISGISNVKSKEKAKISGAMKGIKPHILVIEDNSDNLITLKALLDDKFEISCAEKGYEGIEKAGMICPDLILLDISLPDVDGFKVLDQIRMNGKLSEIPVIALTARAMKGDRENLLAYGFNGYISKPIDNNTFEKTIYEYLK